MKSPKRLAAQCEHLKPQKKSSGLMITVAPKDRALGPGGHSFTNCPRYRSMTSGLHEVRALLKDVLNQRTN